MTKWTRFFPVLNIIQDSFAESCKPGQNQTIDERMIAFKGRLNYVQYLPAKPIKRGINVWMYCDADISYLHLFEVYLSQQQNSEFGLGYDVVDILGENHYVFCDNLFTSVHVLKDLLVCKIYCNEIIWVNKKYLPHDPWCLWIIPGWHLKLGGQFLSRQ